MWRSRAKAGLTIPYDLCRSSTRRRRCARVCTNSFLLARSEHPEHRTRLRSFAVLPAASYDDEQDGLRHALELTEPMRRVMCCNDVDQLDLSAITGPVRKLTQEVTRWALWDYRRWRNAD